MAVSDDDGKVGFEIVNSPDGRYIIDIAESSDAGFKRAAECALLVSPVFRSRLQVIGCGRDQQPN